MSATFLSNSLTAHLLKGRDGILSWMANSSGLRYRELPPRSALQPYIECVWIVWAPQSAAGRAAETIIPDGCPEIIVHLGDPFERRVDSRWRKQPVAFLAGTLSRPWVVRPPRDVRTIGIRFRPGAFPALIPLDMKSATDREVKLASLVGARRVVELLSRLDTPRVDRCLKAAEDWLAEFLPGEIEPRNSSTRRAVQRILRSRGRGSIESVALAAGISRRQLERAFSRDLGIRPKLFARIIRLNAALETFQRNERAGACQVALDAGYFDQAHMSRDFRGVADRGTRRDRLDAGDLARNFSRPERLLALLSGE